MERSARWLKSSILRYTKDPSRGKNLTKNIYFKWLSDNAIFIMSEKTPVKPRSNQAEDLNNQMPNGAVRTDKLGPSRTPVWISDEDFG